MYGQIAVTIGAVAGRVRGILGAAGAPAFASHEVAVAVTLGFVRPAAFECIDDIGLAVGSEGVLVAAVVAGLARGSATLVENKVTHASVRLTFFSWGGQDSGSDGELQ